MNSQTVEITSAGIRKILNKYTPERAISEYIWNGFDAKATVIYINFDIDSSDLDTVKSIRISDNGTGINYDELSFKFKKFYESQKRISSDNNDITRGKNGYGRFTFYKFARIAEWETFYKRGNEIFTYDIKISSETLKDYSTSDPKICDRNTGTIVTFEEITSDISSVFVENVLIPYLKAEFAWFLAIKEDYKIYVNGNELDYSSIIADSESFSIQLSPSEHHEGAFQCQYIRWNQKMNDEYSRFYFLNTELELKKTKTTLLNKKGDNFWHSIIVIDDFFDEINCDNEISEDATSQLRLFDNPKDRRLYKELIAELNNYLKKKRRPFLKQQALILVDKYKEENVFPSFGANDWDIIRRENLEAFVKELYEVEPAVFMKLNKEQKKVFLELLNLVMDSGERDSLFKILDAVIELDSTDRTEFAKILEHTRLKQVISTIKIITDRLLTLENLKKIVFNHSLQANEVRDLQSFIEKHYWIFGEEYRMVCAEEVKFEEALKKYLYILRGVSEKKYMTHPDKYKEMDLFLTGTDFRDGRPHNVVVEIKNPTTIKQLKSEQLGQLERYMDVILKEDCFNDANEYWTFILIGQDYDDIVGRRIANKLNGLVMNGDNYALYVKKWSEIINEIERRLKYLLDKLKIERDTLSKSNSLQEISQEIANNTAVLS